MKLGYILVDTRLEEIYKAIKQNLKFCPKGDLFIYTVSQNIDELNSTVELENFTIHLKTIPSEPLFLVHQYNLMLTDKAFWYKYYEYDRVVIFQSDSEIFKPGIEDFLEYDYIGAPWKEYDPDYYPYVGNGGLSIRNPKVMYNILSENTWGRDMGEDLFFTRMMVDKGYGTLAPLKEAKKFSVESVFQLGSLGAHAIDKWFTEEQCIKIRTQYDNI